MKIFTDEFGISYRIGLTGLEWKMKSSKVWVTFGELRKKNGELRTSGETFEYIKSIKRELKLQEYEL